MFTRPLSQWKRARALSCGSCSNNHSSDVPRPLSRLTSSPLTVYPRSPHTITCTRESARVCDSTFLVTESRSLKESKVVCRPKCSNYPKFNPDNNEIGVIPINKIVYTWQETRIDQDFKIVQIVYDMFAMWESISPKKGFKRLWKTKTLPNMICHFRNLGVSFHPRSEIGEIPINKIGYEIKMK